MCPLPPVMPSKTVMPSDASGFEGVEKRLELLFAPAPAQLRGACLLVVRDGLAGSRQHFGRLRPCTKVVALGLVSPCFAPQTHAALFVNAPLCLSPRAGLRTLSRQQLDGFLQVAQCSIVASSHSDAFDAYVLSESSLFVYADKLIIKTCGTTALLKALPTALQLASSVGAHLLRVRYSRACFKYPAVQPAPHRSWAEECSFLDGVLGARGVAHVLGDGSGLKWHLYSLDARPVAPGTPSVSVATIEALHSARTKASAAASDNSPTFTLEICMTQLDASAAAAFMFGSDMPTARQVTESSGIASLFPQDMVIDDFVFNPCGYSMNGLLGSGLATIHVTPEARCSYASVEISGHATGVFRPDKLVAAACAVFKPGALCVALTVDGCGDVPAEWSAIQLPVGFKEAKGATSTVGLPAGGQVLHMNSVLAKPTAKAPSKTKTRAAVGQLPPSAVAVAPAMALEVM